MDIVYSSSDRYCDIAGISMLSLLEHNKFAVNASRNGFVHTHEDIPLCEKNKAKEK